MAARTSERRSNGSNGSSGSNGRIDVRDMRPDVAMRDWVIVTHGAGYLLGRLHGCTEDDIRQEMDDAAPVASLLPAYVIAAGPHLLPTTKGPAVMLHHDVQRAEWIFNNRGGRVAWHGLLSFFSFVSEQPEAARKYICELIENFERAKVASESGLVVPG